MIKIIIACDNDDNNLRNLKNNKQIELIETKNNVKDIIKNCKKFSPEMLILNLTSNAKNNEIIIKKILKLYSNKCVIVAGMSSKFYLCFNKVHFLLNFIENLYSYKENDTILLEKNILDLLWKLRFNMYAKGTEYVKDAISFAYKDNSLLHDTNELINQLAILYNVDEKNVRNNIDNVLNLAFKDENLQYHINFFNGYYDGRKVTLKYFIALSVYYLKIQIDNNISEDLLNL